MSSALEQQIAQAIQPVLDEFRQNMMHVMEQESRAATDTTGSSATAAQGSAGNETQMAPPVPDASPTPQAAVESSLQQPANQIAQQAASVPQQAEQVAVRNVPAAQQAQGGVLHTVLQTMQRQGEQWLLSVLVSGLTALLTESTHAAIQGRAEQGLHSLLQKAFQALPDGSSNQDIQAKTERLLQAILRESLDAVFTESMRTTLQQGTQLTLRESLNGDVGAALSKMQDMLKSMAEALFSVLRNRRQSVVRLLLALGLLALDSSLAQPEQSTAS